MKLRLLLILCALCLCCGMAHAQTTITISGSFTGSVFGFAPIPETGSTTCQPGPAPLFTPCALPTPSLGVPYSVILSTVGPQTSVTCTVTSGTLASWMTLTAKGTTCVLAGTPLTAGVIPPFTISFSGS